MKLTIAASLLFGTLALSAQDDVAEMRGYMKTIGASNGAIRKNLEAKQSADVAKDAQKLADTYKQVGAYFAKASADDAVKIAKTGEDAATDLATAATAGDMDKASADMKAIGGTCGACHSAHREKLDGGGYKIK